LSSLVAVVVQENWVAELVLVVFDQLLVQQVVEALSKLLYHLHQEPVTQ
jgi:hypothetical protein